MDTLWQNGVETCKILMINDKEKMFAIINSCKLQALKAENSSRDPPTESLISQKDSNRHFSSIASKAANHRTIAAC